MSKTYKHLTDIEHVLQRPEMYIGSMSTHEEQVNLYDKERNLIVPKTVKYVPALLKIFDECIINAVDESKRNKKLNVIKVKIVDNEKIEIFDNGGIDSSYIEKYNCYIPELIFGRLRSGSNFDDTESRDYAGVFGVGIKSANIMSTEFIVETCKNGKHYRQKWNDNMHTKRNPIISDTKEKGFTKVSFIPDFPRFNIENKLEDYIDIFYKRTLDLAATNTNIKFYFNDEIINISSFKDYCNLFNIDSNEFFYDENDNWKFGLTYSDNGFTQVSFTNSISNSLGGTHVDYLLTQVIENLREYFLKKHKIDVRPSEIRGQLFMFVSCNIINNRFNSQTKEKLITDPREFGSEYIIPQKIFKQIYNSEIVKRILDWKKQKEAVNERVELRKLHRSLDKKKIENLYDCTSKNREECDLFIFEGLSALSGAVKFRDTKTQALYSLRGKILNVNNMPMTKVLQNAELSGLISTLGLEIDSKSIKNLRYKRILLTSDMDVDGSNICALLINFFMKYWPDLFSSGKIYRVLTPLMSLEKGRERISIYSDDEYLEFNQKNDIKRYNVSYKKGLGALSDDDTRLMMTEPKLLKLNPDKYSEVSLDVWFGSDSEKRKEVLLYGDERIASMVKSVVDDNFDNDYFEKKSTIEIVDHYSF